jgi:hypothetical protein
MNKIIPINPAQPKRNSYEPKPAVECKRQWYRPAAC